MIAGLFCYQQYLIRERHTRRLLQGVPAQQLGGAGTVCRRRPALRHLMSDMDLSAEFLPSLGDIDAQDWNQLAGGDYPFLRHEFLYGLETTGCTNAESGWQPCHLVLRDAAGLAGHYASVPEVPLLW